MKVGKREGRVAKRQTPVDTELHNTCRNEF